MRKKQRKSYTAAFKVKIALEAIKGQRTINEIATHYGVHPNMVTQWKKQAIESLPDVFSTRRERDAQGEEALKAELYQQIGPQSRTRLAQKYELFLRRIRYRPVSVVFLCSMHQLSRLWRLEVATAKNPRPIGQWMFALDLPSFHR
jgi:transposase